MNVAQVTVNLQECFLIANRFLPRMAHKCRSPRCLREVVNNMLKSCNFNVCLCMRPRILLLDCHSGNDWRSTNRFWSLSLLEQNIGRWFFWNLLQNDAKQILPKESIKHTEEEIDSHWNRNDPNFVASNSEIIHVLQSYGAERWS